jgi:hypothetical protein
MNPVIQGLWIGSELSVMEQMSIASFLANGHSYHLYVYDAIKNVPEGATLLDAGEILPSSRIFKYKRYQSYAGFSNYFRYKLLMEKGGWWADSDLICLRHFDFSEAYVFGTEMDKGIQVISAGVLKAPPGSDLMSYAWGVCDSKDPEQLAWGETGPKLIARGVAEFSLEGYAKPANVFCPISYNDWRKVLEPGIGLPPDPATYAIHLWNEMWRRAGMDKNDQYDPDCLYERLRRKYVGS